MVMVDPHPAKGRCDGEIRRDTPPLRRATAVRRASCGAALDLVGAYSTKERCPGEMLSPSAHDRSAAFQLRPPTSSQRRVSHAVQARRRSLSLGRRRITLACFACVRCRDGCGRPLPCQRTKDAATARCFSPSAQHRGATCRLYSPTLSQRRVSRAELARRRSLSLGRGRSTRP